MGLSLAAGADLVHHLDVIVKDGGNHRNHVGFDHSGPNTFRAADTDVDDTLKRETPFPHFHQILAPALLQDTHKPLNSAIDSQNISNAGGRGCEVCKMIERVNQGQS
jgi:hypothetical protein